MEAMLGAAQSDRPGRRAYAETLGAALLQHLAWSADTGPDEPTADDSILGELLVWIDAHLAQKLSLAEMAARVHMSRALFTRRFRSAIGPSPHQYLISDPPARGHGAAPARRTGARPDVDRAGNRVLEPVSLHGLVSRPHRRNAGTVSRARLIGTRPHETAGASWEAPADAARSARDASAQEGDQPIT